MWKLGIIFGCLATIVVVFYLLREPATLVNGTLNDVEEYIFGLMNAPNESGVLIITIPDTERFVQFTGGVQGVQMDFPLVTFEQKAFQTSIESVGNSMGLSAVTNTGSDGSKFLDFELAGSAKEISSEIERFIMALYHGDQSMQLLFSKYGY